MEDLKNNQAVSILTSLIQERRALMHAESVLKKYIEAEKFLSRLDAEKGKKEKEIAEALERAEKANADAGGAVADAQRAKGETEKIKQGLENEIKDTRSKLNAAQKDLQAFEVEAVKYKAEIQKDIDAKLKELESVKAAFDAFKQEHKL